MSINAGSIPDKFAAKKPVSRTLEFSAYAALPKPIRDAMKDSPLDNDAVVVTKNWWRAKRQGISPELFANLLRQSDQFVTGQIARETYGPSHPQAKV